MTRGQRNHNPLNIKRNPNTHWLGQCPKQRDREFVQFEADLFGLRAAFRILRVYLTLHNLQTLRQVIFRWAPPEDGNATTSYVDLVAMHSGVSPDSLLRWGDRDKLVAIVKAMAWVESRMDNLDEGLLVKAYELAR
jgi:hypothetical protein